MSKQRFRPADLPRPTGSNYLGTLGKFEYEEAAQRAITRSQEIGRWVCLTGIDSSHAQEMLAEGLLHQTRSGYKLTDKALAKIAAYAKKQ